jgi:hypothetical protein
MSDASSLNADADAVGATLVSQIKRIKSVWEGPERVPCRAALCATSGWISDKG